MLDQRRIGIFPGSFDPMTNGHVDLIKRSAPLFDELIVLIAINTQKTSSWFTVEEKVALAKQVVGDIPNVRIEVLKDGLIATYYKDIQASAIVRGVRNATDFDYEYGIDSVNKQQYASLETMILFASEKYRYLSSSLIKEIAFFEGDISGMVPEVVEEALKLKCKEKRQK